MSETAAYIGDLYLSNAALFLVVMLVAILLAAILYSVSVFRR